MDTTFEGNAVYDLSLEHEYLSSAMYESEPLCNGFGEYGTTNLSLEPEPTFASTMNGLTMEVFGSAQYGEFINPDDFLNDVLKSEPSESSEASPSNRDTPSPSGSQQSFESVPSSGGFDGCHVVPMHLESPPISPQAPPSPLDNKFPGAASGPVPTITGNESNISSGLASLRRVKVLPKSSLANGTKTITKKTIVLSARDYNALVANMQRQSSSNTILLKSTPTKKIPIMAAANGCKISSDRSEQHKLPVLPNPQLNSSISGVTTGAGSESTMEKAQSSPGIINPLTMPMILPSGTKLSEQTIDEKVLKKHQRMIKNRQSAYMSRVKKKEYVTSLEDCIQKLTNENEQLRVENANLLERLRIRCSCAASSLLIGNSSAKLVSPTARKNTAIVMAMLFMVSLNFYPLGNLLTNNDRVEFESVSSEGASEYRSRGLLWTNKTIGTASQERASYHLNITALDELMKQDSVESFPATECPFYVNQTENIRLASELRRWIGENGYKNLTDSKGEANLSIDTFDKMFQLKDAIDSMYRHMKDISVQMKTFERRQKLALAGKQKPRKHKRATVGHREITPYHGKLHKQQDLDLYYPSVNVKYAEFFEEIGRRDDTFYLVSFSEEHLLLPALAYNKTNRPRMSLMLPTVAASGGSMPNGTDRSEKITLMQIDCEVMNTSVIHIREKMIPGNLRPQAAGEGSKASATPGKAYGDGRNATTTTFSAHSNRTNGKRAHATDKESRLVRELRSNFSSPTQSEGANGINRKETTGQHQHDSPSRPFFVERMNEHLKSEHHVN